jgi:hypothetical protein
LELSSVEEVLTQDPKEDEGAAEPLADAYISKGRELGFPLPTDRGMRFNEMREVIVTDFVGFIREWRKRAQKAGVLDQGLAANLPELPTSAKDASDALNETGLIESPERARTPVGQQLLFKPSPRTVCDEIGLNWWAALKLRDDGWLSFDPKQELPLDESQESELRFVGALVVAGCDNAMLHRLLDGLCQPYGYRPGQIYFDWVHREWRHLPRPSENATEVFDAWIDSLENGQDLAALQEIKERACDAINRIKECGDKGP